MESIQKLLNMIDTWHHGINRFERCILFCSNLRRPPKNFKSFFVKDYYKFVCMPNVYDPAMRIFTKITKIPSTHLKKKGHESLVSVDDSYLQGKTYEQCLQNIADSINILQKLGFRIHSIKSCLMP